MKLLYLLSFLIASSFACTANADQKVSTKIKGENSKTAGLRCFEIGYRYGHTATRAMKGKKTDPAWDFAVPERCRADPEIDKGIEAGTRSAW